MIKQRTKKDVDNVRVNVQYWERMCILSRGAEHAQFLYRQAIAIYDYELMLWHQHGQLPAPFCKL
jgi:hypothetical protein